jgi:hypothetical protein
MDTDDPIDSSVSIGTRVRECDKPVSNARNKARLLRKSNGFPDRFSLTIVA